MKKKLIPLSFISLLALSSCATGVHHDISEYILSMNYRENFKILQLTDPHIGDKDNQKLHYDFMDLTIRDANADLIVVTGDLFTFAGKTTAKRFCEFMDSYNTPWTVVFGNHDEQCYFSVDWLTNLLNNYSEYCLFKDIQDDDVTGNCNFAINLMDGTTIKEQIILMDTNRYYFGSYFGYDFVKENQQDWYDSLIEHTKTQNGGTLVKSLLFTHIPLPEIDTAYEYGLEHNTILGGTKEEKTCPPKYNSHFYDRIVIKGSTNGIFFGHDHNNDFAVVDENNITFSYGTKSTDRIYYMETKLGGQTITLNNDGTFNIDRIHHNYLEVN